MSWERLMAFSWYFQEIFKGILNTSKAANYNIKSELDIVILMLEPWKNWEIFIVLTKTQTLAIKKEKN